MRRVQTLFRSALSLVRPRAGRVAAGAAAQRVLPPPPLEAGKGGDGRDYGAELDAAIDAMRSSGAEANGAVVQEADMLRAKALPLNAPRATLRALCDTPQELYELGSGFFSGHGGAAADRKRGLLLWKLAAAPAEGEGDGAEDDDGGTRPDPRAMYSYAMAVKAGVRDGEEDDGGAATALRFLKQAASPEIGDARSMAALGHSCETGDLTGTADAREALRWYGRSAEHGGGAQPLIAMGLLYQQGADGLPQDTGKAIHVLKTAVTVAIAEAAAHRGGGGGGGGGGSDHDAPAADLLLLSANIALNELYCADGPHQDWAKGFQACCDAVDAVRAPHALWVLGNHYYFGQGVEESLEEAARVWEEAAELGFAYAQINLGTMYRDGVFFTRDLRRALDYMERASASNEIAAGMAREIRAQLRE